MSQGISDGDLQGHAPQSHQSTESGEGGVSDLRRCYSLQKDRHSQIERERGGGGGGGGWVSQVELIEREFVSCVCVCVCVWCRPRRAFSADRIDQLKQLSKAPDIYDRLARALGQPPSLSLQPQEIQLW